MAFAWISSLSLASILGIVTGFFLGKYSQKAEKKPCEETKEIEEKKAKEVTMEVIFFPDTITQAGDASLSREMKGMLYKEILNQSEPLKRLVAHISSAKVSLDLCLYIMTCRDAAISDGSDSDLRDIITWRIGHGQPKRATCRKCHSIRMYAYCRHTVLCNISIIGP